MIESWEARSEACYIIRQLATFSVGAEVIQYLFSQIQNKKRFWALLIVMTKLLYTAGQSEKDNYFYPKLGLFIGIIYIFLYFVVCSFIFLRNCKR